MAHFLDHCQNWLNFQFHRIQNLVIYRGVIQSSSQTYARRIHLVANQTNF